MGVVIRLIPMGMKGVINFKGIAQISAEAGFSVVLVDIAQNVVDAAMKRIDKT